ncbi:hypothetical protein TorRG33x02_245990 [Trema orientale]|uniref:Uncharacterized protein n=1 Tax=Trema orientale TaxID=63057 RepID=A0A2P5DNF3_TREOI|nr:hypothetical protein TorRG33x02_245990 [Trema orientale]
MSSSSLSLCLSFFLQDFGFYMDFV